MEWFYKIILHHFEGVLYDEMIKWGNESKTSYLRQLLTTLCDGVYTTLHVSLLNKYVESWIL